MDNRYNRHNRRKYSLKVHIVLVTKYRKKLLKGSITDDVKQKIFDIANTRGYEIIAMEADKDHLHFLISYDTTDRVCDIVKIVKQERMARKFLTKDKIELEDEIYRSYGILSNCRKISSEETLKLLSNVKLGTDLGILREMTDLKVLKMYIYSKPANLQKYLGKQYDAIERDIKRAEVIKQIINSN